jgi:hypothetical protein
MNLNRFILMKILAVLKGALKAASQLEDDVA